MKVHRLLKVVFGSKGGIELLMEAKASRVGGLGVRVV